MRAKVNAAAAGASRSCTNASGVGARPDGTEKGETREMTKRDRGSKEERDAGIHIVGNIIPT